MRRFPSVLALVLLFLATAPATARAAAEVDLIGTPDLVVRQDMLGGQWLVREEFLPATFCSVQEGNITPGDRLLLRFTVGVANVGDADIAIGDPQAHVDANDGLFEFATCHQHYHFRNYAQYELIDPASGKVWRAAKRGFCMLDTDPNPANLGEPARSHIFRNCGAIGIPGNQGISHGWTDTYRFFLGGQYFVLDGGDGQQPVPPGTYVIRITANPPYKGSGKNPCRFLDPATGDCHTLQESNYANNVGEVTITIPPHPGRAGVGPLKDEPAITEEKPEH